MSFFSEAQVDDTTLLLLLLFILTLILSVYHSRLYAPLTHPIVLGRQADFARVRNNGESTVLRNSNAPHGFPLAHAPETSVRRPEDLLAAKDGRVDLFETKTTKAELLNRVRALRAGLMSLTGKGASDLFVVASLADCAELLVAELAVSRPLLLLPSHTTVPALPTTPGPLATSLVSLPHLPAALILDLPTAASLVTDSARLHPSSLVVLVNFEEGRQAGVFETVKESLREKGWKAVGFEDVIRTGERKGEDDHQEAANEKEKEDGGFVELATGDREMRLRISQENILSGVASIMSLFPAHDVPSDKDVVLTSFGLDQPVGTSLGWMCAYTGAALRSAAFLDDEEETDASLAQKLSKNAPTVLFVTLSHARLLNSLLTPKSLSPLHRLGERFKLVRLRHGAYVKDTLWDRLVFQGLRNKVGLGSVRAIVIVGDGFSSTPQHLLDSLRLRLGTPVLNAYLPISSPSGHQLASAPVTSSHPYDLQAFIEDENYEAGGGSGTATATHVGSPCVGCELKLRLDDAEAKGESAFGPGEILVRGPIVLAPSPSAPAAAGASLSSGSEQKAWSDGGWMSTGDRAYIRSNGTLRVVGRVGQ